MWKGASEEEIKARVQRGDLPREAFGRAAVPAVLEEICRRALSLRPEARYATALELADALEEALPQLGPLISRRRIGAMVAGLFREVSAETRNAIERQVVSQFDGAGSGAIAITGRRTTGKNTITAGAAATRAADGDRPPTPLAARQGRGEAAGGERHRARWLRPALVGSVALGAVLSAMWATGVPPHANQQVARGSLPVGGLSSPDDFSHQGGLSMAEVTGAPNGTARPLVVSQVSSAGPHSEESMHHPMGEISKDASSVGLTAAPAAGGKLAAARSIHRRRVHDHPADTGPPTHPDISTALSAPRGASDSGGLDCEHPFFVDGDGIKKFRPECR
jgi:hypothetical protein